MSHINRWVGQNRKRRPGHAGPRAGSVSPVSKRAVAVLILAIGLTGCAGARNMLNTGASVCFKALPGANEAVQRRGHLVGVRRLQAELLQQRLPNHGSLETMAPETDLCVFAFSGTFTSSQVAMAPPGATGTYAVVALAGNRPTEVAAWVVDRLPTRFRHLGA
jgi:hypothetical protein